MNGTASAAVSVLTRPFARIPEAQRKRICLIAADRGRAGISDPASQ